MSRWLQGFAYRNLINPLIFLCSLVITFTISFLVISNHMLKLARVSPSELIRYE